MVTIYNRRFEPYQKNLVGRKRRRKLVVAFVTILLAPYAALNWAQSGSNVSSNARGGDIAVLDNRPASAEIRNQKVTAEFKKGLDAYLKRDFATAHATWLPLAEQGDAVSAFNLGVLYARGQGTTVDAARAVHWYRKAADVGYVLAQFNLGAAYMTGQGVEEDHNRAAQWWARAAQGGHPQALFNLGTLYLHGDGVPLDPAKAANLIQKAADLGDTRAFKKIQELNDPTAPPPAATVADAYRNAAKANDVIAEPQIRNQRAQKQLPPQSVAGNTTANVVDAAQSKPSSKQKPAKQKPATWVMAARSGDQATIKTAASTAEPDRAKQRNGQRDNHFLAAADPQQWTIQVSAFTNKEQAQQFIKQHGLGAEAILIEAKVKGRNWYKVLYGVYANDTQARRGIDRMSKTLRKRSPWARRIGVVQKELVLDVPAASAGTAPAASEAANTPPKQSDEAKSAKTGEWRSVPAPAKASKPVEHRAPPHPAEVKKPVVTPVKKEPPAPREPASVAAVTPAKQISGDDRAQLQTGQSAFNRQDYQTALATWTPLAAKGLDDAQYGLGFMYESGWGVKKDYVKAYQWYRRAAEQGHAKSQFNLGLLYQAGLGVPKNEALANYWIQSAADRDDPRAKEFLRNLRQKNQR